MKICGVMDTADEDLWLLKICGVMDTAEDLWGHGHS